MSTHWYYMLVNLGCLIVPFLFSFHPKLQFHKQWKAFLQGTLAMMALFIPWDIFFTAQGIWGFNSKYTCGLFLFGLPIEEWLFFICIPYACVFTYHCFGILMRKEPDSKLWNGIAWLLIIACFTIAIVYHHHWYTCASHALCGLLLFYHVFWRHSPYLPRFLFMYTIILIPFILSNGVLTGIDFWNYSFINKDVHAIREMIVWYDNSHNLGIRIFSVPVDDISYGLTMLLLVVTVFERYKNTTKPALQ
jgi:lycopene cyclase domain-containing protein